MAPDDSKTSVLSVLRSVVPTAPEAIDPQTAFRDQFEMDSLDFLNFVLALEQAHGVRIPENLYPRCATLAGAIAVLEEAAAAGRS